MAAGEIYKRKGPAMIGTIFLSIAISALGIFGVVWTLWMEEGRRPNPRRRN
ncbi:hypothetical protein ACFYXH_42100 [Streptomyces sp. NPDC002730]|uniref:hypothetical protein n=1 Tax=Streptomyces sp. NPDC002730 TaxID=3364662 RepID=UPI0036A9EA15